MILVTESVGSVCVRWYMVGTHILHTHNSCTTTCTHRGVPVHICMCIMVSIFT